MAKKILEMRGIVKNFPGVQALNDVDFDLHEGEVHGLVGENGAGKSTLIKILSGDHIMSSGEVFIDEEKVDFKSPADSQTIGIRVIYQELVTMDTLSVAENIFVGNISKNRSGFVDWKYMNKKSRDVLERMNVDINPKKVVGDLSIHQKQIVEIAKAINKEAKILVMDEPTAALGEDDTESLFEIIKNLKKHGVGIIYISHRLDEVFEITDRVTVLRDGKKIGTEITNETEKAKLISMMVGRELDSFYAKKDTKVGEVLMEVKGLTINRIVQDISFSLKSGEILGLFGLLGSGRLNITRALYGLTGIDKGEIYINGKKQLINTPRKAVNSKIGFLPIDRKLEGLALGLDVRTNITMAHIDNMGSGAFLDIDYETERCNKWIKDINIKTSSLDVEVNNLSGGNQQKIVIAKLLETGSRIFLMNEPTRGIDVGAKAEIYVLMEKLCEAGAGIIMISSEMPEILSMADRILVISEGRITAEYDSDDADQEKLLSSATISV